MCIGANNENKELKKEQIRKTASLKSEIDKLKHELERIGALSINEKEEEIAKLNEQISKLTDNIKTKQKDAENLNDKLSDLKKQIIETEEIILLQSFGLYTPKYEFANSEKYKSLLESVRIEQKNMIKSNAAVTGNMKWTVNGSASQGQKMVKDMQKLLLRAFNGECEETIDGLKFTNFDSSLKRITASYEAISKLGKIMDVAITKKYYDSKIDELHIALEYQRQKQQEKEEQKVIREQLREEAKLQKEIEEERKKIEKEQTHYQSALSKLKIQYEKTSDTEKEELLQKIQEIETKLTDVEKALADVDYRQANQKAGYVYVISNIGAFGENVYKIGMTRRLDPQERIDELGDASVPFNFDVHAMIFCDDAPALENALHKAFENKKLNWVNTRREFFNVTLDEIKEVVKNNYDKTAEFIDLPDAEQYRISQKMKQEKTG